MFVRKVSFLGCKEFIVHRYLQSFPSNIWYCSIPIAIASFANLCSTLFIVNMTFDRCYSILRPHKAASFNTVKRAGVTITCIVTFCFCFAIPHLFTTLHEDGRCSPIGKVADEVHGQVYSWLTSLLNFFLPFVLLLLMNSIIIYTLKRRTLFHEVTSEGQGHIESKGQGHSSKSRHADTQITLTLLLVTFTFLVLMMPSCVILIFVLVFDYFKSPQAFASFYLFRNIAGQTYFTNSGINFFLYVVSGEKFRTDLVNLFNCIWKSTPE